MAAICDYDWEMAEKHHRKAMTAVSIPAAVRMRYALCYLLPLGRVAEAIEQSRLALETDPLSMILHGGMAWSMYAAKQYLETLEYARKALEIDANFYLIWSVMGLAQLHAGFPTGGDYQLENELWSWRPGGTWGWGHAAA